MKNSSSFSPDDGGVIQTADRNAVECRMSSLKHWTFLALWLAGMTIPRDASGQSRENLLKAGYIEKFTHFIEWPDATGIRDSTGVFSITVIGEDKYGGAIEKLFSKVKVKNRRVRVSHISSVDESDECMILVVPESAKTRLDEILNHTAGKPVLTIGDTRGFGKKGVIINMFIDQNRIRYEINKTALDKSGLQISSFLLASAVIVESDE
jgi:hypothetical protein